jgi:hypothetical protein
MRNQTKDPDDKTRILVFGHWASLGIRLGLKIQMDGS